MNEENQTKVYLTQLQDLNVRSHQYMTRLWQLPFAYVAVCALALGVGELRRGVSAVVALILGVIGIVVFLHIKCGLRDGAKRAVRGIGAMEERLGLTDTKGEAKWEPRWYISPLEFIVGMVAVTELVFAGLLFWGS